MKILLIKMALLDHGVSHHSCHVTPPPPPPLYLSPPAQNTFLQLCIHPSIIISNFPIHPSIRPSVRPSAVILDFDPNHPSIHWALSSLTLLMSLEVFFKGDRCLQQAIHGRSNIFVMCQAKKEYPLTFFILCWETEAQVLWKLFYKAFMCHS